MPQYKLKKIKLSELEETQEKPKEDLSTNEDEAELPEGSNDDPNNSDDAPEEVTFSMSKKATLETERNVRGNLRDIEEKKKEKRKRIQERNTRQKLEKQKQKVVEESTGSKTVSTTDNLQKSLPLAALSDDDDEDGDEDDDKETDNSNLPDEEDETEFTEDKNFIPITRGIKVVPLTKKVKKTNPVNFRQQALYGGRIKRDSVQEHYRKKLKKLVK